MNPFSSRYKKVSGGMWPEVRVLTKYNGLGYVNPWMRPFVSTDLVVAKWFSDYLCIPMLFDAFTRRFDHKLFSTLYVLVFNF